MPIKTSISLLSQKKMAAGIKYTKATGKKTNAITGTNAKHMHPIQKYTILAFFMKASIPYKKEKCYNYVNNLYCFFG